MSVETERTVEEVMKKKEYEENLKKAVNNSHDATVKLEKLEKELGSKLNEACVGIDCLKKDREKDMKQIEERLKRIEEPLFVCENCGDKAVRALSSFCPNCGSRIPEWKDDDGKPVAGWTPYWERMGVNKK